ncbi:MAG TPA: hypothetical protein OIM45_06505 [Clostridiaceae bacterium]|nr:hypothetical protein [Clostridiaceae bacterium]
MVSDMLLPVYTSAQLHILIQFQLSGISKGISSVISLIVPSSNFS